jgi:hypothetical protein
MGDISKSQRVALAWKPPPCKRCQVKPVNSNGYCHGCNPRPVIRRVHYIDEPLKDGICIGWQTEERLPDGRMATIVHRLSNLECGENGR